MPEGGNKKPIIQIQIDDSRFQDFLKKFEDYQTALQELPEDWRAAGAAMDKATAGAGSQADAISEQSDALQSLKAHARSLDIIWTGGAARWREMSVAAENTKKSVGEIARHFLSFGKLGGIAGALVGVGGITGSVAAMIELTRIGTDLRNRSLGIGVPARQLQSFGASFGSYFNAEPMLAQIADIQNTPGGEATFAALGLPQDFTKRPAAAFLDIVQQIHREWADTPRATRAAMPWFSAARALGFDQETMRQIGSLPGAELRQTIAQFREGVRRSPELDRRLKRIQELDKAFRDLTNILENKVIAAFGDLAPLLTAMVKGLQHPSAIAKKTFEMFSPSGWKFPEADWLGKNEEAWKAAHGGAMPPKEIEDQWRAQWDKANPPPPALDWWGNLERWWYGKPMRVGPAPAHPGTGPQSAITVPNMPGSSPRLAASTARFRQYYNFLTQREHLTPAQATAILNNIWAESGGKPRIIGDHRTSGGLLQEHADRFAAMVKAVPNWRTNWQGQLAYGIAEARAIDPKFFSADYHGDLSDEWQFGFEKPKHPVLGSREHFGSFYREQIAAELKRRMPVHPAAAASAPAPQLVEGGALVRTIHPVAAAREGRQPKLTIENKTGSNLVVSSSQLF